MIARFGLTRTIAASLLAFLAAYLLFLDIGAHSNYFVALLPTMLLAGIGFALGYGPLNVAATTGIADHEQGLASGLVTASFQIGGALVLAVATAVINATATGSTSAPALLDGYRAGVIVSVVAAGLGLLVTVLGPLAERRRAPAAACSAA